MKTGLDLSAFLGNITDYVNLKGSGKLGRVQELWERYCGLRMRIAKLIAQLNEIERKLLQEDPSFFEPRKSLVGNSFLFRPKLEETPSPQVAFRNAIIVQASSLTAQETCRRLDSYDVSFPERWHKDFPTVKSWQDAYEHRRCRPRVEKLISEVKAHRHLP